MVSKVKGESGINLARVVHCSEVMSALKCFQALSKNVPGHMGPYTATGNRIPGYTLSYLIKTFV